MNLALILEMTASGMDDRVAVSTGERALTYAELLALSGRAADLVDEVGATAVIYLGTNHAALPVALFGAAIAGVPFIPLNYRLGDKQLDQMVLAHPGALMVHEREPSPGWTTLGRAR